MAGRPSSACCGDEDCHRGEFALTVREGGPSALAEPDCDAGHRGKIAPAVGDEGPLTPDHREGDIVLDVFGVGPSALELTGKANDGGRPRRSWLDGRLWRAGSILRNLAKVVGVALVAGVLLVGILNWPVWLIDNEVVHRRVMSVLFLIGLALVALEDLVGIDKAAVMLILAAVLWVYAAVSFHPRSSKEGAELLHHDLRKGLEDTGGIVLFLLPAMGVVESIDHFDGFSVVTSFIHRRVSGKRLRLLPIVCLFSFFMSAVIDNLTATIVSLKILRHVVPGDDDFRRLCGGLVVIAANAGGAWSPIGDVTTTMLWIQGKITAPRTVTGLIMPSLVAALVPLAGICCEACRRAPALGAVEAAVPPEVTASSAMVLILGVSCILMVPVLKICTGLPPYLGMLFALGIVWVVTEWMSPGTEQTGGADGKDPRTPDLPSALALGERRPGSPPPGQRREAQLDGVEDADSTSEQSGPSSPRAPEKPHTVGLGGVPAALRKVDLTGLLFFAGVLLAVVALDSAGVLKRYAEAMREVTHDNPVALSALLGVSSAVVDNVPLVEASIEMFEHVHVDDPLWQLVALAAGTGGSILSVGSIAGVTLMSMEGVGFRWYARRISPWAAVGFGLGLGAYQLQGLLLAKA